MLNVPPRLEAAFEERWRKMAIPDSALGSHKKWLRCYLDFFSGNAAQKKTGSFFWSEGEV
jgi:hypothetical protein